MVRVDITENCNLAQICDLLGDNWNDEMVFDIAERFDLPVTDAFAAERFDLPVTDAFAANLWEGHPKHTRS